MIIFDNNNRPGFLHWNVQLSAANYCLVVVATAHCNCCHISTANLEIVATACLATFHLLSSPAQVLWLIHSSIIYRMYVAWFSVYTREPFRNFASRSEIICHPLRIFGTRINVCRGHHKKSFHFVVYYMISILWLYINML